MRLRRIIITTAAAAMWSTAAAIIIAGAFGDTGGQEAEQASTFCLVAGTTLSIYLFITRYVVAPRAAYRLGWEARARSDHSPEAEVVDMSEYRRARL